MKISLLLVLYCTAAIAQTTVRVDTIVSAASTFLRKPAALAVGVDGILYIADTGNHRLLALDSIGTILFESSSGGSGGDLRWPGDVTVGAAGKVLVSDAGNRRIVEYSRLLEWRGELTLTSAEGDALEPRAIAATPSGGLYAFESDEGELRRYDSFNTLIAKIGGRSGRSLAGILDLSASDAGGVFWIDARDHAIYTTDALLSAPHRLTSTQFPLVHRVVAVDSSWIAVTDSGLARGDLRDAAPAWLSGLDLGTSALADCDIAARSAQQLFLLDSRRGALFRLWWP